MLGKIENIEENIVFIKINFDINKMRNLINSFILIKDLNNQYIAEIIKIQADVIKANIIGEYHDNNVWYGVNNKPSYGAEIYLLDNSFVPKIIGEYTNDRKTLLIGKSPIYNHNIGVNLDSFFGSHFAIFGSTGSGKSCGFARIMQNLFVNNKPKESNIIIFDAYGEYHNAFKNLTNADINFKAITTDVKSEDEILNIPLWLLDVDDLSLLLNATKSIQLTLLDKTLRLLNVFNTKTVDSVKYKNSIIASSLMEILLSGRNSVQIRDQFISILSKYSTENLNLESKIIEPGYTRTLRQCLLIDGSGKINAIENVEAFLANFIINDTELSLPDGSYKYTLNDLMEALDFALIDEGIWKSEDVYNLTNFLKVRLYNLIKSDYSLFFETEEYVSREQFIYNLFHSKDGKKVQLVNFNINYIDDRFAKTITKIYSKLLFNYAKNLDERASMPFNIILEEAHRYVQNDNDVQIIGYNIFERICKEGRKYGVLMGFISQRPSELSETCLSQCSNFFVFKITHPRDLDFVSLSLPYISEEIIQKIKTLNSGACMVFGKSFKFPLLVSFSLPDPTPQSENAKITEIWYK